MNKAYSSMVGYLPEELAGKNIASLEHKLGEEEIKQVIQVLGEMGTQEFETIHLSKSGDKIHLKTKLSLVSGDDGSRFVFGLVQNVSDIYATREKLEQSEKRWEKLLYLTPQPVSVIKDNRYVFLNESALKLFGAGSESDMLGRPVTDFILEEESVKILDRLSKLSMNQVLPAVETRIRRLDGEVRNVEVHSTPFLYNGAYSVQSVLYDITQQLQYNKKIKQALREKELLLKEVHHRVKNNMALVSGMLELQLMNESDEKIREKLKRGFNRVHTIAMVHEILYDNPTFTGIDLSKQVQRMLEKITLENRAAVNAVILTGQISRLNIKQALPAALLINEMIQLCLHNLPDSNEKVQQEDLLEIQLAGEGDYILIRFLKSSGLPDFASLKHSGDTNLELSGELISSLCGQLEAELEHNVPQVANLLFRRHKSGVFQTFDDEELNGH